LPGLAITELHWEAGLNGIPGLRINNKC
jgi:hypothetical protein